MVELAVPIDTAKYKRDKKPAYIVDDNPRGSFVDEMRSYGLEVPNLPVIGKIERVKGPTDKAGKKNCWYFYNEVNDDYQPGAVIGIGVFGDWKGSIDRTVWSSKRRDSMSPAEIARFDEQMKAEKMARDEELRQRRTLAAETAKKIWAEATAAPDAHPYLSAKQITPNGVKVSRGNIVVPVKENNEITSLQFIDPNGGKKFLGGGKVKGCSYKIEGKYDVVYVCEGFATGATLHEVTFSTVYVAFNAGNLMEVASAARDENPDSEIVIAGDDDHSTDGNPGRSKAAAAGDVMRCKVIFPEVSGDDTDFNDMARASGKDKVKELIEEVASIERLQAANENLNSGYDPFPIHCLNVDGFLGDTCDWINSCALIKQPILTLAATLAFFGAVFGRRYKVAGLNTHTNLMAVGLLATGGGKDNVRKRLKTLLHEAELSKLLAGGEFTSGSGVISSLVDHPSKIAFLDEYGKYMKAMTGRNASSQLAGVNKTIMELYSDSGSVYTGTEFSTLALRTKDKPKRKDIINPSLNIYATSTQSTFFDPLVGGDISSGFLNRLLVFEGDDDAAMEPASLRQQRVTEPPTGLVMRLVDAYNAISQPDVEPDQQAVAMPNMRDVEIADDTWQILEGVVEEQELRRRDKRESHPELWARLFENTIKVAAIRAIADAYNAPVIKLNHAEWARDIVRWCVANMSRRLTENLADSERERSVKDIYRYIADAGKNGRSASDIARKFQRLNKRDRAEMMEDLERNIGVIKSASEKRGNSNRSTLVYFVVGSL